MLSKVLKMLGCAGLLVSHSAHEGRPEPRNASDKDRALSP